MADFLFRGSLEELDPDVFELTQLEAERQVRKIILIPSESQAPLAVREAMASAFQNIYAEGYPDEETRTLTENEIFDYEMRLGYFRRYSDPRYYKGVEYADIVEALARRRCAELFAANGVSPDQIFVNVQALSGAPANNAVYHALVNPGETILGMNLLHGGHLTHGSPVNRSGKLYNAVHYTVDPQTEQIDYDQIAELARQHRPKIIIAGFSSYPWMVDWERYKAIAQEVGAFLLADIAHVAGLVACSVYPSPIGIADVITFTTHKSLCGPRGACILTTNSGLARKIDRAVFPGEQGGPHVNIFGAMALAFKLAKTETFSQLQHQMVRNCITLTERLKELGFRIPYGGTNTHLTNLDCSQIIGSDGTSLSGDQAARILDIAGIVVNRNTIPGDKSALDPNGIRMGTPWVTQRGLREPDMLEVADLIGALLKSTHPFGLEGRKGSARRAKVDFEIFEKTRTQARKIAERAGRDFDPQPHGYPHFYFTDDHSDGREWAVFEVRGEKSKSFLNFALTSDVEGLMPGGCQPTRIYTPLGEVNGSLKLAETGHYQLTLPARQAGIASTWLRDLSDGYVQYGDDLFGKLPGPIAISDTMAAPVAQIPGNPVASFKPFYIGAQRVVSESLADFSWVDRESPLRRTPLFESHKGLGAKVIPFAGWEMPVWYTSVVEEHMAVREAAGIFDVAHMGVYQVEGSDSANFLDCVVGNDIAALAIGESCYTHYLTPDADVIDDLLVYRRGQNKFLVVVNASNDDKDWAWLNAVKDGEVCIDRERPSSRAFGRNVVLRNLRDPREGSDMRVDIALQGPRSRDILLSLGVDSETRKRIIALKRTELCEAVVGHFDLVVSRTGYTGEKMAFELFVHPDRSADLFTTLLDVGGQYGLKPVGLGARDSLRTEAGLPLYGHEMGAGSGKAGEPDLGVAEAGFGSYVKPYKPWFIGRKKFLQREQNRKGMVIRFRFNEKGVRMAHGGDPVLDKRGKMVGWVTSCAVDREGFLTGQAFVDVKNGDEGNTLVIYQSAADKPGKAPAELTIGEKSTLPTPATVISRFPK